MKAKQLKLKVRDTSGNQFEEIPVRAYEFLPGLFIHKALELGVETWVQTKAPIWVISHKSGFRVCSFEDYILSRKSILKHAIPILGKLDWTWEEAPSDPKEKEKYLSAIRKLLRRIEEISSRSN